MKYTAIILALLIMLTACTSTVDQLAANADNASPSADVQTSSKPSSAGASEASPQTTAELSGTGKIVVGIKDKAVGLTNVNSIKLSITSIMLHKQSGWETLNTRDKEFDLLALNSKGITELFAEEEIPAGNYDIVQLNVAKVEVVESGENKNAILPSKVVRIKTAFTVEDGKTSSIVFDFIASESLHTTGLGRIIFSPVIKVEARKNAQALMSGNSVSITAGDFTANEKVGMDINGNVDVNLKIDPNADLSYENSRILLKKENVVVEKRLGSESADSPENDTVAIGATYGLQTRLGDYSTDKSSGPCTLHSGGSNCV